MDVNERLRTQPISTLLVEMSIPAICAQIVTLLYNMVDRMFVGHLPDGTLAMAAIGLCNPIVTIITAFSRLLGAGGAPLCSISLGRNDKDHAEHILSNSLTAMVAVSALITALTLLFCEPLLSVFGASANTMPYARDYLSIYSMGTIFVLLTLGMNPFLTAQGFARAAMVTTMLGGVLNCVLDPIFIYGLGMGVKGAAIATVLSQMASCAWVFRILAGGRSTLKIRRKYLRPSWPILRDTVGLGLSPFFMTSSEGFLQASFNIQVLRFGGDLGVSAMTIIHSLRQLIQFLLTGLSQGAQPIQSFNYGAGQYGRVRQCFRQTLTVSLMVSFSLAALMMLFPTVFVKIYNNNDPELIALSGSLLRVYVSSSLVTGAFNTWQQGYNALGKGKLSFFFAFLRKIILLIPLIFILPALLPQLGLYAVVLAEPVADLIATGANGIYFYGRFSPRYLQREEGKKAAVSE